MCEKVYTYGTFVKWDLSKRLIRKVFPEDSW